MIKFKRQMIKKLDSKDLKTTMIIIAQKKMKCKSKNYENTKAYKLYENTKTCLQNYLIYEATNLLTNCLIVRILRI